MRELDLIVGHWALLNLPKYQLEQLKRFDYEVLGHETPELLKKIMGQLEIGKEEHIISQIKEFAFDGKYSKIDET